MSNHQFDLWCSKYPHKAIVVLNDLQSLGFQVELIEEIPKFTEVSFQNPFASADNPIFGYIFKTLDRRSPVWQNSHTSNGYARRSFFQVLWFGLEEKVFKDGSSKFMLRTIHEQNRLIRESITDEFPLERGAVLTAIHPDRDLSRLDLSGLDLTGLDMSGSKIPTSMQSTVLNHANLKGTWCEGRYITTGLKRNHDNETLRIGGPEFHNSIMNNACFDNARLNFCDFIHSSAIGASFENAQLWFTTILNAQFRASNFSYAFLEGHGDACFDEIFATGARIELQGEFTFQNAYFQNAILAFGSEEFDRPNLLDFSHSTFDSSFFHFYSTSKVRFSGSQLKGVELRSFKVVEINLDDASLDNCKFLDCNIEGMSAQRAVMNQVDLTGANLYRANLQDAKLDGICLAGANFEDANLSGCSLRGANLKGARFGKYTCLKDVDLTGADLGHTTLIKTLRPLGRGRLSETGGIGLAIHSQTVMPDGALSNRNIEVLDDPYFRKLSSKFFARN